MLLDDTLDYGWSGAVVPHAFWVNHHDGALLADAQTIGLGSKNNGIPFLNRSVEVEFLQAVFQVIPGF